MRAAAAARSGSDSGRRRWRSRSSFLIPQVFCSISSSEQKSKRRTTIACSSYSHLWIRSGLEEKGYNIRTPRVHGDCKRRLRRVASRGQAEEDRLQRRRIEGTQQIAGGGWQGRKTNE